MTIATCIYCKKTYRKAQNTERCWSCEKQFKSIFEKISKRYGLALKGLAGK